MEDYNDPNKLGAGVIDAETGYELRKGTTINFDGLDYIEKCLKVESAEYGITFRINCEKDSKLYTDSGWRCYLIGGENGHLRWVKTDKKKFVHYDYAPGNRLHKNYVSYDQVIVEEYHTSKRSKDEVYSVFFKMSEPEALKQLAWWQFQFQPLKVLSKYKPLFVGGGLFIAAALLGKIHGRV